jgi:hypothetical protein
MEISIAAEKLFMLGALLANNHNMTLSAGEMTIAAHGFDRGSDLHSREKKESSGL